jgi:hypothetical protein
MARERPPNSQSSPSGSRAAITGVVASCTEATASASLPRLPPVVPCYSPGGAADPRGTGAAGRKAKWRQWFRFRDLSAARAMALRSLGPASEESAMSSSMVKIITIIALALVRRA